MAEEDEGLEGDLEVGVTDVEEVERPRGKNVGFEDFVASSLAVNASPRVWRPVHPEVSGAMPSYMNVISTVPDNADSLGRHTRVTLGGARLVDHAA